MIATTDMMKHRHPPKVLKTRFTMSHSNIERWLLVGYHVYVGISPAVYGHSLSDVGRRSLNSSGANERRIGRHQRQEVTNFKPTTCEVDRVLIHKLTQPLEASE